MNRIRSWIVRTVFGPAQSEAPGDGLVRMDYDAMRDAMTREPLPLNVGVDISAYITEADVTTSELEQELTMKLTAADLNNTHLGKAVTVTRDETTVAGMLAGIRHHADLIEDHRSMFDATPDLVLGRGECIATIAHVGDITLDPSSEVTVAE